jgi:ribosomal protein L37E
MYFIYAGNDDASSNQKEGAMGLFRRKKTTEDDRERCPRCGEPVPERADECAMCGLDLKPFHSDAPDPRQTIPRGL